MLEIRNACRFFVRKVEVKRPLEDIGTDVRVLLKWILKTWCGRVLTGLIWRRI
jgi:hypothetical protein